MNTPALFTKTDKYYIVKLICVLGNLTMFNDEFKRYLTSKNILFGAGAVLFIILIFCIQETALMFFASFVVACSLEPAVSRLESKFKRKTAAAIVLLGFLLLVCAFLGPIIAAVTHEIKAFSDNFPQYADNIKNLAVSSHIMNISILENIDIAGMISSISGASSKIISQALNAGKNIGSALVYLIVSLLITFYFMTEGEKIKAAVLRLFPSEIRERTGEIIDAIAKRSGGYILAQIVTMASVGIIVTLGLMLLKNEYALLLGLVSAVFDIVPVAGPAAAFVICMIAVSKSGALTVVLAAAVFGAAQLVENNFVRPYIFGRFLDIHPLIIFLSLFIAAKYCGIIGVIFAPAAAAAAVVILEEVYIKNMDNI